MSVAKGKDVLTRLKNATYLGSHPERTGQEKHVDVTFFTQGVQADRDRPTKSGQDTLMSRWWGEVYDLRAEDRDEIERRITASRLAVMGVFALAFPKKRGSSYLTVADEHGEWIFAIPNLSAMELSGGIRPLQARVQHLMAQPLPAPNPVPSTTPLPAESGQEEVTIRLQRLQGLLDSGLLQPDEYAAKRQEIIDSL